MLVPAAGHGLDDGGYWEPREATRQVGSMKAGYVRLQAFPDHAQPEELRHARRMLQAARSGSPAFAQLNDHPRGEAPARPAWLRGGAWAANRAILQKLAALQPCS